MITTPCRIGATSSKLINIKGIGKSLFDLETGSLDILNSDHPAVFCKLALPHCKTKHSTVRTSLFFF